MRTLGNTACPALRAGPRSVARARTSVRAHATVKLTTRDGTVTSLEVPEGTTILDAALDAGLDVSYDCKMGVCMTCPAKLKSGEVDQAAGMLSEDVQEQGYVLLCVAEPKTNECEICEIEEDELLEVQMGA